MNECVYCFLERTFVSAQLDYFSTFFYLFFILLASIPNWNIIGLTWNWYDVKATLNRSITKESIIKCFCGILYTSVKGCFSWVREILRLNFESHFPKLLYIVCRFQKNLFVVNRVKKSKLWFNLYSHFLSLHLKSNLPRQMFKALISFYMFISRCVATFSTSFFCFSF